ncbi:MAG: DUF1559 domain-containing protein [Planctomycetaceae bacterium]
MFTPLVSTSNYVGSMGVHSNGTSHGVIYQLSKVRLRDITDGTSNTFLVGERAFGDVAGTGPGGASVWSGATDSTSCGGSLPNACTNTFHSPTRHQINTGLVLNTTTGQTESFVPFSSRHTGGAQFVMCDGSVHFISDNIDSRVGDLTDPLTWGIYQWLSERDDGQVIGEF